MGTTSTACSMAVMRLQDDELADIVQGRSQM